MQQYLKTKSCMTIFRNVSKAFICNNEDDTCLLVRSLLGFGKYSFVGGGAKRGEGAQDAMVREIEEEIGITVDMVQKIVALPGTHVSEDRRLFLSIKNSTQLFEVWVSKKNIPLRINWEISDYRWVPRTRISEFLSPHYNSLFRYFL